MSTHLIKKKHLMLDVHIIMWKNQCQSFKEDKFAVCKWFTLYVHVSTHE